MKRVVASTASSFDFNSHRAYPPTTSLASVKGPSVTVSFPPEMRTLVPLADGRRPPLPSIVPALTASSLSFPMASINSLGGKPHFSADLTIVMNRMVVAPCGLGLGVGPSGQFQPAEPSLHLDVERRTVKSTTRTNYFKTEARHDYGFAAFFCSSSRSACSRAASSGGKTSAGKSDASYTWRISTSVPPSNGARLSHSTASSMDFSCHSQKPPMSSLVSAKGPSIIVRCCPENRTRLPFELGCSPSPASITPALTSSSLNFPMAANVFLVSSVGRIPASEFLSALTITMNRIGVSPCGFWFRARLPDGLDRLNPGSTYTSNECY